MGREDSQSPNSKVIRSTPEPVDRLNLIGRWIGTKLQEIGAAEQRIDKRLEHLAVAENSIKNLFDALRKQVGETQPVLKELAQLRASALTAVEQVVRASKDRKEQVLQAAPIDEMIPIVEKRLANQFVEYEQKINTLMQQAEQTLVTRVGKLDEDLDANVRTVTEYAEHRLLTMQQNADAIANRVTDQLRVVEGRTNE